MEKITTDNQWKNFAYRSDVPKKILKSQFDYQNEEDSQDGFFKYRNTWYHLDMFESLHSPWGPPPRSPSPLSKNWDGIHTDSAFSGVLIKVSKDGEQYKVGTVITT